jgi:hypothetical protein
VAQLAGEHDFLAAARARVRAKLGIDPEPDGRCARWRTGRGRREDRVDVSERSLFAALKPTATQRGSDGVDRGGLCVVDDRNDSGVMEAGDLDDPVRTLEGAVDHNDVPAQVADEFEQLLRPAREAMVCGASAALTVPARASPRRAVRAGLERSRGG